MATTDETVRAAMAEANEVMGNAVRTLGVGAVIHLSQTHPALFESLDSALRFTSQAPR